LWYDVSQAVAAAVLLMWVGRPFRIRPPALFALYVAFYTFGRTFEELLRVDPSHRFLGERLNFWVSIIVFVCAVAFFIWWQFMRAEGDKPVARRRKPRPIPKGPAMAAPRGRVRKPR